MLNWRFTTLKLTTTGELLVSILSVLNGEVFCYLKVFKFDVTVNVITLCWQISSELHLCSTWHYVTDGQLLCSVVPKLCVLCTTNLIHLPVLRYAASWMKLIPLIASRCPKTVWLAATMSFSIKEHTMLSLWVLMMRRSKGGNTSRPLVILYTAVDCLLSRPVTGHRQNFCISSI